MKKINRRAYFNADGIHYFIANKGEKISGSGLKKCGYIPCRLLDSRTVRRMQAVINEAKVVASLSLDGDGKIFKYPLLRYLLAKLEEK